MDKYSIINQSSPWLKPVPETNPAPPPKQPLPEVLRFPKETAGKSMVELAERDLEATLQLLAERARHLTGASGAAIALREAKEMICRASTGVSAPQIGTQLQVDSGLTGESVRSGQVLRCDHAEADPRVNRESCQALGIASIIVMPLLREGSAVGVFELLSERTQAFEDRDIEALKRLSEMVLTALDHAEAAQHADKKIQAAEEPAQVIAPGSSIVAPVPERHPASPASPGAVPAKAEETDELKSLKELVALRNARAAQAASTNGPANGSTLEIPPAPALVVRKCASCGFPVSEGRSLCLDCEEKKRSFPSHTEPERAPLFLTHSATQSWWQEHGYTLGTVLITVVTAGVLFFWYRFR